jgi:diaminohydroxyphosphoribosylaminopyrimidine deaminase/5-amino-6-(5-phosphoribosylamino)uracil reductase
VDAVLIGAETARRDNPRLTVREVEVPTQPWRIVLTRSGDLPFDSLHLLKDEFRDRTLVFKNVSWEKLWEEMSRRNIQRVLVEGGGHLLNQMASMDLIDESVLYYAPFNLENPSLVRAEVFRQLPLSNPVTTSIGPDLKIRGKVINSV